MPRSTRNTREDPLRDDARVIHVLRCAAVAAILFDLSSALALLDLPDAELGRLFKTRLAQVIGLSTALNIDQRSVREQDKKQPGETNLGPNPRTSIRYSLVAKGKLLRTAVVCEALGITEQRLGKDVAASRIFSVEIEGEQYYPAFFLANELDRKDLAKVVRRLDGLTGWRKWNFFTKPKASLGNLTPLQALLCGDMKQVLHAASALVEE
ncbi:hypothetical protein [Caballeronia sp. LjRoot31]|uniref:hypothetical protein n=1 Tax=Caballeronia sp. LjRoot31 TaxID=3342324 RepID=UPI003ED06EA4